MNIAVFADVHGRILLAFKLCARWQRETGRRVDLILQAGDLGAFPDLARLDRATLKHAGDGPTELGFLAIPLLRAHGAAVHAPPRRERRDRVVQAGGSALGHDDARAVAASRRDGHTAMGWSGQPCFRGGR